MYNKSIMSLFTQNNDNGRAVRLLEFDTRHRVRGTPTDAIMQYQNTRGVLEALTLKSFKCPHFFPNIPFGSVLTIQRVTAGNNYDPTAATISVPVTANTYDVNTLVVEINAQLTTLTLNITFSVTTVAGLSMITWVDNDATDTLVVQTNTVNINKQLIKQLGITPADLLLKGGGALTPSGIADLSYPDVIQVRSASFGGTGYSITSTGLEDDLIASFSTVNTPFGGTILFEGSDLLHDLIWPALPTQLHGEHHFRLTDTDGNDLDFGDPTSTQNFGFTLTFIASVVTHANA